jgi:ATP-dependent DNA helicase RecQ
MVEAKIQQELGKMPFLKNTLLSFYMTDFYNDKVKELFGLDYLFPWQRLVIANTLEGAGYFGEERQRDSSRRNLIILPTGAGKSLCFLMPALMIEGITLILYPLLALMNDQARRLREAGEKPILFRGGQTREEREQAWRDLQEGKSRFILTNPETASSKNFQNQLTSLRIIHLVIDEVHTIPQWGPTFRKSLLSVGDLIENNSFPVITAFTATASPDYQEKIGQLVFRKESFNRIMANPDRANIHYHVIYTPFILLALEELCLRREKPLLIFCRTRAQTEETARYLHRKTVGRNGVREVRFYHAGLTRKEKEETEAWFLKEKGALLTATSAYGMGVNARGLQTVIHRDIPYSVESYIQEAGRAGRDGAEAHALLLAPPEGTWNKKREREEKSSMDAYVHTKDRCRRTFLMNVLGWESEYCGGCDHCTPETYIPITNHCEKTLMKLFSLYNRCFTKKEWVDFLKGYGGGFKRSLPGFGSLRVLDSDLIQELFTLFEKKGVISIYRRGLWRKRLIFQKKEMKEEGNI